jgi:hypothetical protein
MSIDNTTLYRRGELLAEFFLQELNPVFLMGAQYDNFRGFDVDFLAGFKNTRGGINIVAVEVKSTDKDVRRNFVVPERVYDFLVNSNVIGMLLVVNVKSNKVYYHFASGEASRLQSNVRVSVDEANAESKENILKALRSSHWNDSSKKGIGIRSKA